MTAATVREARGEDVLALVQLIRALGYDVDQAGVTARFGGTRPPLVAETDGIVGCLTWAITPVLHRPRPVGRITMLVVAEDMRGQGIGELLVRAAEDRLRDEGCGLVEVTSNVRRDRAHAFYERLGYERSSYRFYRSLVG